MLVVPKQAWAALQAKARLWWMGWAAAGTVLVLAGAVILKVDRVAARMFELQLRQDAQDRQNYETAQMAAGIVRDQDKAGKALVEAAEAVQLRITISDLNKKNAPLGVLTKRTRPGMVTP